MVKVPPVRRFRPIWQHVGRVAFNTGAPVRLMSPFRPGRVTAVEGRAGILSGNGARMTTEPDGF
jgi:hypothetical protein